MDLMFSFLRAKPIIFDIKLKDFYLNFARFYGSNV